MIFSMDYKLIRSKRKTLSICVSDGVVTVKAPLKTSVRHIEDFLADKEKWINKKLSEQARRSDILADVISGESIMYCGLILPIAVTDRVKRVAISDDAVCVPIKFAEKQACLRAVTAQFKRLAAKQLEEELGSVSEQTGLSYDRFATTNARTKWGSCDGKNRIRLNWRLLMLDKQLRRYVEIHELSHTVHHDHSAAFWSEVKKHMPEYAAAKKRLKTFSVLTTLYR